MGRSVTAFLMLMKTLGLPREQQTLPRVSTFFMANSYSSLQEKLDYWTFTSNFVLFSFLQPETKNQNFLTWNLNWSMAFTFYLRLYLTGQLKVKMLVPRSCSTLCISVGCSPPGFSVYGILQARILEWVAISFSKGSS